MFHSILLGSLTELRESRVDTLNRLTVKQARALKERGIDRANPTLYLHVAPGGSKSWIQGFTIVGRRTAFPCPTQPWKCWRKLWSTASSRASGPGAPIQVATRSLPVLGSKSTG